MPRPEDQPREHKLFIAERKPIIPLLKSIIPAADVSDLDTFKTLVKETGRIEGIGGYKFGLELMIPYGVERVVDVARQETEKPMILDYQKAGNDIPDMGPKFAKAVKKAGVTAAILFPFTSPQTQERWTASLQDEGIAVIVGGHMTHKEFLRSEGGYIADDAPERIYTKAAEMGVRDFVVPGNKVEFVQKYRELLEQLIGKGFTLYAPGFVDQGGDVAETGKVAGENWHAIVGGGIYKAPKDKGISMGEAAQQLADKILAVK